MWRFCVNVLDAAESNTKPREELQFGKFNKVGATEMKQASVEIWRWIAAAALAVSDVRVVVLPSEDRLNWPLVYNSLVVSGAATAPAVAGGALAALWFAGLGGSWRRLFLAAAVAPWSCRLSWPPIAGLGCWGKRVSGGAGCR